MRCVMRCMYALCLHARPHYVPTHVPYVPCPVHAYTYTRLKLCPLTQGLVARLDSVELVARSPRDINAAEVWARLWTLEALIIPT
jgi:hypothetical protein